jgi:predicted 3-demethylubiquinone-9 3-methyltransferase (glyoxalase superfamily)
MQKITTFLWFDNQAEEAANFYCSVFKNSKINSTMKANGQVLTVTFSLEGQEFIALNGGPLFKFTEAISLFVSCETQEEIDQMWTKLTSNGGQESMCGWLKDKYGLSWQIVPPALGQMLSDKDPVKSKRAMDAMMKMHKLDIAVLKKAYNG